MKYPFQQKFQGFTLIELLLVMTIFSLLALLITVNLLEFKHNSSLSTTINSLIADIKNQQIKAMTGDTEGRGVMDSYGIYFSANSYVLFHGASYSSSDTTNFSASLPDTLQFTGITFPNSSVIFASGSGEIIGFSVGSNTVILKDTQSNVQKTITINRRGAITQVN